MSAGSTVAGLRGLGVNAGVQSMMALGPWFNASLCLRQRLLCFGAARHAAGAPLAAASAPVLTAAAVVDPRFGCCRDPDAPATFSTSSTSCTAFSEPPITPRTYHTGSPSASPSPCSSSSSSSSPSPLEFRIAPPPPSPSWSAAPSSAAAPKPASAFAAFNPPAAAAAPAAGSLRYLPSRQAFSMLPAPPPELSALAAVPPQRHLSVQPEAAVYAGPSPRTPARVTLRTIRKKYDAGEPLTMVTAYDYPSAVHVEAAGIDICLVGDSAAMVVHGHDTTLPIRLEEMISHCRAVARGARRAFLVGDLPFGCYETDVRDAVQSAVRMLKEGGMDAVKLEGGSPARVEAARAIVESGVAVMGHVGLTPQSVSVIGGFRPQAQVADEALRVLEQAQALQRAGCFAVVLECVPGPIAAAITRALDVPTIGIGAGGECSGQVLVYHDLLGMMSHPHHAKVSPKFCKQYARVGDIIGAALQQYRREVEDRTFPGTRYSPYGISGHEVELLARALRNRGLEAAAEAAVDEARKVEEAKAEAAAAAAPGVAAASCGAGGGGGGGGSMGKGSTGGGA